MSVSRLSRMCLAGNKHRGTDLIEKLDKRQMAYVIHELIDAVQDLAIHLDEVKEKVAPKPTQEQEDDGFFEHDLYNDFYENSIRLTEFWNTDNPEHAWEAVCNSPKY